MSQKPETPVKYWQVEFVHRGFTRLIGEKTTLMKTHAVTEKIIGCYALFLSIHGISVVNSSDWTSNLLRDAECSQGINNHHWVPHGLVFGHTSSLAAPTMLSVFLPRVFKCFHSFLADESPLVSKSFLLSSLPQRPPSPSLLVLTASKDSIWLMHQHPWKHQLPSRQALTRIAVPFT